jgi:hypothetical protein
MMMRHEMTLERLEPLAVLQTHEVVVNRFLRIDGRPLLLGVWRRRRCDRREMALLTSMTNFARSDVGIGLFPT